MNNDLISRSALKKEFGYTDEWYKGRTICAIIDNAPTVEPDVNCSHCDYFKFSQSFIENVVKVMTDYNIETVEDLMKELNHINELLGGRE